MTEKPILRVVTDSDAETETDPLVGQVLTKQYRIVRKLGEGGMGVVYLAEHASLKKQVAIKILAVGRGREAVDRFHSEAKTAAQIHSQHVVQVLDHFSDDVGNHYIVMEYIAGMDLDQILTRDGPLPLARMMPLIRQTGRGLSAAHKLGIVHRDIKLENILIVNDDGEEFAKITDFGIAKILDDGMSKRLERKPMTRAGGFLGTPNCMAPEQVAQQEVDVRTDVYAFGVLVYRALTGFYPIDADTIHELFSRIVSEPPVRIDVYAPELTHLWPVLEKALAKDRNDRYPDVRAFVEALEDAAGVPRPSRVSGQHAALPADEGIGSAPTLDVTGARALKHDREALTQDAPQALPPPLNRTAPAGLWQLAVLIGSLLVIGVGMAFAITVYDARHPRTPAVIETPAPVEPEVRAPPRVPVPEAEPARERSHVRSAAPVAPVVPREAPPPAHPVREAPVAAPAVDRDHEACRDGLTVRRHPPGWAAHCRAYLAESCGSGSGRAIDCDLIEAALRRGR